MQRTRIGLAALATIVACAGGCGETYYSSDDAWLGLDVPAGGLEQLLVRVVTEPEAYPEREYSNAVRLAYRRGRNATDEVPEVTLESVEDREVNEFVGGLNLLDAWDGCPRDATCDRTFVIAVGCESRDDCRGGISADAYLSTQLGGSGRAPDGSLQLELSVP
jgi:hypothetical protein